MKTKPRKTQRAARRRRPVRPTEAAVQQAPPVVTPAPAPVAEPVHKMVTIWFLVGLVLLSMGGIVFLSGLYYLISPNEVRTVLYELHPDIWWGGIMVAAGLLFVLTNRKVRID